MAQPIKTVTAPFDEAKLATMTPPLTVRVEKLKNNMRTPIVLPANDDGTPGGTNFAIEDVRLVEEWVRTTAPGGGGGYYEITVTDSAPSPATMKWRPFWDPKTMPEIGLDGVPTVPAGGQVVPISPMQPNPQFQQGRQMPAWPNGFPQPPAPMMTPFMPQQFYAPQQPYGYPPLGQPPPVGTPQWGMYQAEGDKRRMEEENRALREAQAVAERAALQAKHEAELRAREASNEGRFARVESQMGELRTIIGDLAKLLSTSTTRSPELEEMRRQNEALQRQAEIDRREREAERREAALLLQLKTSQEQTDRKIEEMRRQSEEALRAAAAAAQTRGNDPIVMMLQEQARQHADAIKELARAQASSLDKMQAMMMRPQDMFQIAKESTLAAESSADRVASQMARVIEMQQKVTENALQMAPQGNGALDVVRDGLSGLQNIAERYMTGKATEKRIDADAKRMEIEAQGRIIQAQLFAQAQAAQAQPAQPALATPPHLAGLKTSADPVLPPPPKPSKKAKAQATKDGEAPAATPGKRLGKTDEEWFGALLPNVLELRAEVAHFIESCNIGRNTPAGVPEGLLPEQAAIHVLQAVGQVVQAKYPVACMIELFFEQRYADFVDVLLPAAPQAYKDDLTVAMIAGIKKFKEAGGDGTETVDKSQVAKPVEAEADADDDDDADDDADDNDADDDPETEVH